MGVGPESMRLDGRRAVVTGSARGIGAACVDVLAAFGARVHGCDKDPVDDATARIDVRDPDAVATWASSIGAPVHVLVNNAGGGFRAAFADLSVRAQDTLIRENFTQVADVTRAFLPVLADRASVVNLTSIEAHRAAPGFAVYAAMKAAVANLTSTLALELGERGIRVNCVAADVIATAGVGPLTGIRTPLGGPGAPEDVAGVIAFLASDLARFVTGTTLHVDGGNHAAGGWRRSDDGSWST